jgi:hypothetical protein
MQVYAKFGKEFAIGEGVFLVIVRPKRLASKSSKIHGAHILVLAHMQLLGLPLDSDRRNIARPHYHTRSLAYLRCFSSSVSSGL